MEEPKQHENTTKKGKKKRPKPKTWYGKIWYFLWHEDSAWSWIANIIIAIIIIKFVFFPVLGLFFGTSHPIVAVVSGSMEHKITMGDDPAIRGATVPMMCGKVFNDTANFKGDFDQYWQYCGGWYENESGYNISKEQFLSFPYWSGFDKGDIMFIVRKKPESIKVGDVLVFQSKARSDPIIHRVVNKWFDGEEYHFATKGDHNSDSTQIYYGCQKVLDQGQIKYKYHSVDKNTPGAIKIIDELDITEDEIYNKNPKYCTADDYCTNGDTCIAVDKNTNNAILAKPKARLGVAKFRMPLLGYIKLGFSGLINVFR